MTKETAFFIQILSDHIARKKTELTDVISWAEIARMAHVHQVEGIVYYQCQEIIPLPYKKSLKNIIYQQRIVIQIEKLLFMRSSRHLIILEF